MATLREIKKRLRHAGLMSGLKDLGFSEGPTGFWFYRERGWFIDVIWLQPIASGRSVRIHISVNLPETVPDYDFSNFPKDFDGGYQNNTYKKLTRDGIEYGGSDWRIEKESELTAMVQGVVKLVESDLIPWFDAINSKKMLYHAIHENVRTAEGRKHIYESLLKDA